MSNKNEIPEEGGSVNWDKLQNFSQKGGGKRKQKQLPKERPFIKAVARNLTEEEKAMPYPDEFIAEINIMRGEFISSGLDLNNIEEGADDDFDDNDEDDFDTVDDLLDEDDDFEDDDLLDEEKEDK